MKKTGLLIIVLLAFFLIKCKDNSSDPIDDKIITGDFNTNINIQADPRIELLAAIQHYTSWAIIRHTKFDFAYKNELNSYFTNYSQHAAVAKSQALTIASFNYDAPPAFVLYLGSLPAFDKVTPYSGYLIARAGGEENLTDFANKMKDFAAVSNFMTFFNAHQNFYAEIVSGIKQTLGGHDYIKMIEDYYGTKKKSYNIIPAPLFHAGGYGPQVSTNDGDDIYNICGPQSVVDGKPKFGDQNYMLYVVLHEFSHSFVNPVTEKNIDEINKCSKLMDPIKDKMAAQNYSEWATCVNEHLVRVNVARFIFKLKGEALKNQCLDSEYQNGFIYIRQLYSLLDQYENSRAVYTTYESFYPKIIELFKSLM